MSSQRPWTALGLAALVGVATAGCADAQERFERGEPAVTVSEIDDPCDFFTDDELEYLGLQRSDSESEDAGPDAEADSAAFSGCFFFATMQLLGQEPNAISNVWVAFWERDADFMAEVYTTGDIPIAYEQVDDGVYEYETDASALRGERVCYRLVQAGESESVVVQVTMDGGAYQHLDACAALGEIAPAIEAKTVSDQ